MILLFLFHFQFVIILYDCRNTLNIAISHGIRSIFDHTMQHTYIDDINIETGGLGKFGGGNMVYDGVSWEPNLYIVIKDESKLLLHI